MELAVGASGATIKSLLSKLGELLAEEYALIRGVRGDIQFINDELASMQAFLINLSASDTDDHDVQTVDWMKQVRDVSFDIEDCVDNFSHGLRPDSQRSKFWRLLWGILESGTRRDITIQVAELKQRAQHVGERRCRYGVRDPKDGKTSSSSGATGYLAAENQEITRELITVKKAVGVKKMDELQKWMSYNDKKELAVLSIYGFGGVGKTTIAKSLFRDSEDQFEHRAIVTVSQTTKTMDILENILRQVKPHARTDEEQGQGSDGAMTGRKSVLRAIWNRIRPPAQNQEEDDEKHKDIKEESRILQTDRQDKPQASSQEQQCRGSAGTMPGGKSVPRSIWSRIISPARNLEEDHEKHKGIKEESQSNHQTDSGEEQGQGSAGTGAMSGGKSVCRSILSRIICRAQNQEGDHEKLKIIITELQNYLKNKRYLLLIDDVWSTPTWHSIKRHLPVNDNGSRIIVTTRFQAVATACCPNKAFDHVYTVDVLSKDEREDRDEPKELFEKSMLECKRAAANQHKMGNVPDRVWEMCGGLPLAIVTMAGLVASKPLSDNTEWKDVCKSLFPGHEKCHKPDDFMRIIKYCYSELPGDLKTCSLYLSIFPKGRKFSRKRLMRRWIAEGFVSEKQGLSVEDVAETFLTQLIERKIIWPVEHNSDGRVKSCQVHDMILEYIMSKAGEEDFVTVIGGYWSTPTRSNKIRRLSLHSSDSGHTKKADSMNLSHVRSLTVFGSLDQLRFKSLKTRIVQVLDLEDCRGFNKAGNVRGICEMTLLKYLSLRKTDISELPSNIGNLKYLETLDVRQTKIQVLPKSVGQLERLNNILGGDKETRKTLKLPKDFKGIMKGLRILSGIEIVEGSTVVTNLRYFTRLRKLAIYKLHKDDKMFDELLSSVLYLSDYSLQSLIFDDVASDFLNTPSEGPKETSYPWDLRTLELSGKLTTIPKWLPDLNELIKLSLSATALRTENLALLSKLRSLFSLTFSISAANKDPDMAAILEKNKSESRGDIFLPAKGFVKLKLLRIFVPLLPSLNFTEKGTPLLERLELRFKRLEGVHGMDKLKELHDVILAVDEKAGELTKRMVHDLTIGSSSKKYTLIVNKYHG